MTELQSEDVQGDASMDESFADEMLEASAQKVKRVEPIIFITRTAMLVAAGLWFVIWVMTVVSPPSPNVRTIISLQATGSWLTLVPAIIVSYFVKGKTASLIFGIIFIVLLVMSLIPFTYSHLLSMF